MDAKVPVLALLGTSALALTASTVLRLLDIEAELLEWGGLLAAGLAISIGWSLDRIQEAKNPADEVRRWQTLKVLSILLNGLVTLALLVLIGGLIWGDPEGGFGRLATLLVWGLGIVTLATFLQALRNDLRLDRSMTVAVAHVVTVLLAFGASAYAVIGGGTDTPLVLLVAWSLIGLDLFLTRSVPSVYTLLSDPRGGYQGHDHFSRGKTVFLPLAIAFALLMGIFLFVIAAGPGAERAADATAANPLVAAVAVIVTGAAVITILIARRLASDEDRPELYQSSVDQEQARGRTLLWVSATLGVIGALLAAVVLSGRGGILSETYWVDVLAAAALLSIGPYGFYAAYEDRRIRALEERLPDFLRDIAASHKGGLTLQAAVRVSARGDYGALTPYVKRMADQMTWNVSFAKSLEWLAAQMRTPLVGRTVHLILEADRSGGGTADILMAASRDARELKKMETDRRISLGLYTLVIHITFAVFLLVAAVLYNQFVPQVVAAGEAQAASDSFAAPENLQVSQTSLSSYRAFYYVAALVQAIGGGLVAGLMTTGKVRLGLQHAFIMVALAFLVFTFLLL